MSHPSPIAQAAANSMRRLAHNPLRDTGNVQPETEADDCPNCGKPCPARKFVAGVCPACKTNLAIQHDKILHPKKARTEEKKADRDRNAFFDEESNRIRTTDDAESGEGVLTRYCHQFGVNMEDAMHMESFWANHFGIAAVGGNEAQKARELIQRIVAMLAGLINYAGDKKMFARAIALRLGWNSIAGGNSLVAVAKKCSTKKHIVGKATFEKCFSVVTDLANLKHLPPLPILPGGRTEEQSKTIAEAVKGTWHEGKEV